MPQGKPAADPGGRAHWSVLWAVLNLARMPDGSKVPSPLAHTLLALAIYWPRIWPSQTTLARQLHISPRQVNRRLADLEAAGLISRRPGRPGYSTHYGLNLAAIRGGTDVDVRDPLTPPADHSIRTEVPKDGAAVSEGDDPLAGMLNE